jgi:hypothetical protein
MSTRDTVDSIQTHYVAIADRPSRAVALLEESSGWLGSEKITVEQATPAIVSPNIDLKQEALWQI